MEPLRTHAAARHHAARAQRRALTLLEVLVASVLLGVGVTGLIAVATLAMRNQQSTELRTAALYVAQQQCAEIERVGAEVWSLAYPLKGEEQRGPVLFAWEVAIDDLAVGALYDVTITVQWSSAASHGQVSLETWLNDFAANAETTESTSPPGGPGAPRR